MKQLILQASEDHAPEDFTEHFRDYSKQQNLTPVQGVTQYKESNAEPFKTTHLCLWPY